MSSNQSAPSAAERRRIPVERRRSIFHALWQGNFHRRRLAPRRQADRHPVITDWFEAKWLATSLGILLLTCVDAILTITLLGRGAEEINPFMKPLVHGSGWSFALTKFGLTALGVVFLTLLAKLRVFGSIVVGSILWVVLAAYVVLVAYELHLLGLGF
jgi:hypothetical protein